jgi:hypothetical protein
MRDYKAAKEVLEPLEELGEDVSLERDYLSILELLNDYKLDEDEKIEKVLAIYKKTHRLTQLVFEYLFRVDPKRAWEELDLSKVELLSEILWRCDAKRLNLDIISKSGFLRELFSARGLIDVAKSSTVFEFDVLIKLEKKANATLSFEYICDSCKSVAPFAFSRCSSCHAIDTAQAEYTLSRDYSKEYCEENNSFQ